MPGLWELGPLRARLEVDAQGIDVLPFQPYLEDRVNFLFTSGRIGTKGNLVFDGSGEGPARVNYDGSVDITDFATIEKSNSNDLLKWKSLNLNALQFNLEPFKLNIGEINLGDFYSRLILGADGKMNLQKLTPESEEKKAEPPPEKTTVKAPEAKAPDKPAPAAPSAAAEEKAITIGKINLDRRQRQLQRSVHQTQLQRQSHRRPGNDFRAQTGSARRYRHQSPPRQCRAGGDQRQTQPAVERIISRHSGRCQGDRAEPDDALFGALCRLWHRKRQAFV